MTVPEAFTIKVWKYCGVAASAIKATSAVDVHTSDVINWEVMTPAQSYIWCTVITVSGAVDRCSTQ